MVRNQRANVGFEHVVDLDDIGRQLSTGFASLDLLNERNDFRPNQREHCVHLRDEFQKRCEEQKQLNIYFFESLNLIGFLACLDR